MCVCVHLQLSATVIWLQMLAMIDSECVSVCVSDVDAETVRG